MSPSIYFVPECQLTQPTVKVGKIMNETYVCYLVAK
jgi:hypothetical protein